MDNVLLVGGSAFTLGGGYLVYLIGKDVKDGRITSRQAVKPAVISVALVALGVSSLAYLTYRISPVGGRFVSGKFRASDFKMKKVVLEELPKLTDAEFQQIGEFKNLRTLFLTDLPELRDISAVKHCKQLEYLSIWNCDQIQGDALKKIFKSCPKLKWISFIGGPATDEILCTLGPRAMDEITLYGLAELKNLSFLKELTSVKKLEIAKCSNLGAEAKKILAEVKDRIG